MKQILHLLTCALGAGATDSASTICVYNMAGFVLKWQLVNVHDNAETAPTSIYPIGQVKCIEAADLQSLQPGAQLVPVVKAIGGKEVTAGSMSYDSITATQITYVCRGTTLDFGCKVEPPPPTAAEVAVMVGEFLAGFVEGLGADIGFADCLADVNATHTDLVDLVTFFEEGINKFKPARIVEAFQLLGKLLRDFGKSINQCITSGTNMEQQLIDIGEDLTGDPLGTIVKVLVNEGVTIFNNRVDITADCKAITADWKAGDFHGSGHAVGDIIGIMIDGMQNYAALDLSAPANVSASTICVYNYAGFVLKWKLFNVDDETETSMSSIYPIGQIKCIEAASLVGVQSGTQMVPVVSAVWGKTNTAALSITYDPINSTVVTYVCRGTTQFYSCKPEDPPPTAAEVAKNVGDFVVGFAEGLGGELGFAECLADVNETYSDLVDLVMFFGDGINRLKPDYIGKAFEKMGKVAQDFGVAIKACIAGAGNLHEEFLKLAASLLVGDVIGTIIRVVISEGMQIWQHHVDLTADCKAVSADWKAGDFKGSGYAVGDIIGILLNGLASAPEANALETNALEAPTIV